MLEVLECLKCSLNAMKKCYDLSLRGKISKILFCFFSFPFVFYEIQSTLALRTPRYYGHPAIKDTL